MMMGSANILRFDRKEFAQFAYTSFGEAGYALAVGMIDDFNADIHRNPWLGYREQKFDDIVALNELFRSESLTTTNGTFLDQRFIDYLHANEPDISKMNWRKFEGLVGEYFTREGYLVELGPGRGDDGIDARVWPKERAPGDPATIVVQCKRQKEAISKVVVKSLWADLIAEGAHSGLIVTTSKLSPGADKTCKVRQYPIEVVDGKSVTRWLEAMKSPKAGMFLAE
jgi:restriction system protein